MDQGRIKTLLDEASERYNEGKYDQAIRLWEEALTHDPSNQTAREGIRMASLLTADWESDGKEPAAVSAPDEATGGDVDKERVEAGISRVRELLKTGQVAEALEGSTLLEEIAPQDDGVRALAEEVKRAVLAAGASRPARGVRAGGGGDRIETLLATARQALADGRNKEASEAARRALLIDPACMEACGILSMTADDDLATTPIRIEDATGAATPPVPQAAVKAALPGPAETAAPAEAARASAPAAPPVAPAGPAAPGAFAGFDFEPGAMSFDEPAPHAAPAGGTADEISDLIARGQEALKARRPQEAIEVWSRIFAIDSGNSEAGMLIDKARAALEEQARQIDDLYYRAIDAREAGRRDEAADLLKQVLALSPSHPDARAALDEVTAPPDAGATAEPGRERAPRPPASGARKTPPAPAPAFQETATMSTIPLAYEHGPARRSSSRAPVTPLARMPSGSGGSGSSILKRLLLGVAGAIALFGVGVGAWLWFGSDGGSMPLALATVATSPVPAAASPPAGQPPPRPAAPMTVVPGGTAPATPSATTPPASTSPAATPPGAATPDAPAAADQKRERAIALTESARQHAREKRWAQAVLAFREAHALNPVEFDAQNELDVAMAELEKQAQLERELGQATTYFGEGDYASALHKFYRLQQDFPDMREVETWIENSWFNWGVVLLQSGATTEAAEKFGEVLAIDGDDPVATRALDMARRYKGRQRDALYESFASQLMPRKMDQRS